ncbi:hypothetical protein SELMODRAFT_74502, partial [Selaginella moellendorffii]
DYKSYQALLHGGEEVVSILESMIEVLDDVTSLDKESEDTAIQMAALACIGQRLEHLDGSFMMALDLMIAQASKDKDDKKKQLLDVIKETTLAQLTEKASPVLQIVSMLSHTPDKEHRRQILRSAAGGGGIHSASGGGTVTVPEGNLLHIANQANDLINDMEEKPKVNDRKLLAKLILIREEAHDMLGGGILDERNKPGLKSLPAPEVVNFISKLVAVRPGPLLREKLENVMRGRDEGADVEMEESQEGDEVELLKNVKVKKMKMVLPVRPGMFLETVTKLLGGMYNNKTAAGITVQHLDWTYRTTLEILQEIAHGKHSVKNETNADNTKDFKTSSS